MPALLEADPETGDDNPFADLIGGENGGPAFQNVGGRFGPVPKAEVNTPTALGAFADLVPGDTGSRIADTGNEEVGAFSDLVPVTPTSETEKAVAEADQPSREATAGRQADMSVPHQILNSVRVFGSAAGRYIYHGLQGWQMEKAKLLANPTAEMVQPQPEAVLLPKEEQERLEKQYIAETQAAAPEALVKAEYWKLRAEHSDRDMGVDPALADTIPARLSAAAGEATAMGLESLVPHAGLPLMLFHGALAAEAEAKNNGATDEEAERTAVRSAIGLGIFGGVSKIAAVGVAGLLPKVASDPTRLTKFIAQFAGQEVANEASTRAIGAWNAAAEAPEGQKVEAAVKAIGETTLEATTLNTVYALLHASRAAGAGKREVVGKSPEVRPDGVTEFEASLDPAIAERLAKERAAVRPASEPEPAAAAMTGVVPETMRYVEPAQEAVPALEAQQVPRTTADRGQLKAVPDRRETPSSPVETDVDMPGTTDLPLRVRNQDTLARPEPTASEPIVNDWTQATAPEALKAAKRPLEEIETEIGRLKRQTVADKSMSDEAFHSAAMRIKELEAERSRDYPERQAEIERFQNQPQNWSASITPITKASDTAKGGKTSSRYESEEIPAAAMGIVAPGTAQLQAAGAAAAAGAKALAKGATSLKEFHDFRRARLRWSARGQASTGEITTAAKQIQKAIPSPIRRAAITNWIQAGGDTAVLHQRAMASKNLLLRRGYEAALTLTPEEKAVAGKVRQTYDILRKRAAAHGIEINELDNYVNQIWRRSALKEFGTTFGGKKLSASVRFAKKRYHESFFHGEQAGLMPETKDIAKLLPIYLSEVNNAINAKQFVAEMAKAKASDGRPLLSPRGGARVVDEPAKQPDLLREERDGAVLVFPDKAKGDTSDYRVLDQPALHAWKWVGEENGKPIMLKGDLAVHPEAYSHLKNVLGQSAIREWYQAPSEGPLLNLGKGATKFLLDDVQQVGKATMLGFLSPFHQVQEGTHAIGHKVNPFGGLEKIDLRKPKQRDAAEHGVMLLPDRISAQQFREGLDGSSRNLVANVLGKAGGKIGRTIKEWSDGYQHYLFHEYIPALKLKTYEHIVERNQKRFAKELASGAATIEQVKFLSAEQTNAAYGHLNYADMGRNPTLQHLAQVFLLAPDFLEARGRFAAQAVRGIASKTGREQLAAIATLGVTQFVLARILNKTLDDDYHWDEPFAVVVDGRKYTMRSVPEDIYKAFQDWRKFTTGRLSPLIGRGLLEGLSGINYRNEPTTIGETFTNILAGMMPLTLQPATRGLTETTRDNPVSPFEQLLGALGLHVSRFSPTSKVYHLAKDWQEANGIERKRGLYPRSKYQQLRYALEDGDMDRAQAAYDKLIADGEKKGSLGENFRESILSPFTGTLATDRKFRTSLSADDRKIYDAAVKRRHEILRRYQLMRAGR